MSKPFKCRREVATSGGIGYCVLDEGHDGRCQLFPRIESAPESAAPSREFIESAYAALPEWVKRAMIGAAYEKNLLPPNIVPMVVKRCIYSGCDLPQTMDLLAQALNAAYVDLWCKYIALAINVPVPVKYPEAVETFAP